MSGRHAWRGGSNFYCSSLRSAAGGIIFFRRLEKELVQRADLPFAGRSWARRHVHVMSLAAAHDVNVVDLDDDQACRGGGVAEDVGDTVVDCIGLRRGSRSMTMFETSVPFRKDFMPRAGLRVK